MKILVPRTEGRLLIKQSYKATKIERKNTEKEFENQIIQEQKLKQIIMFSKLDFQAKLWKHTKHMNTKKETQPYPQ